MVSKTRLYHILSHLEPEHALIERLLDVIEFDIVPLTKAGVSQGNKIFGAAILNDSATELIHCGTNEEMQCPLYHGEIATIKGFYESKRNQSVHNRDCIFFSTHEPCSMCLSAITWSGFKRIYYFFSYADTKNAFQIPHDLNILKQVFGKTKNDNCNEYYYAQKNEYFESFHIANLVDAMQSTDEILKTKIRKRIEKITRMYDELSQQYQKNKHQNEIPLN